MIVLTLPYPPSVNRYWRSPNKGRLAGRTLISEEGRAYRAAALEALACTDLGPALTGRLRVEIVATMPDRRRRDLDNLLKPLLDALTHASVWLDDEQIDDLRITRGGVRRGEQAVRVSIEEMSWWPAR